MLERIFSLGVALLATHELDAMTHREWELLLPFLSSDFGRLVFVLLHIPIFYMLFYFQGHRDARKQCRFRVLLSAFLIIHGLAHLIFSQIHDRYTFSPPIETITVYGGAICGMVYLSLRKSKAHIA